MVFHWFRRDLRLSDNRALHRALSAGASVQPVFIFDPQILEKLEKKDLRVQFLWEQLEEINEQLKPFGARVWIFYGDPAQVWQSLLEQFSPKAVSFNRDYEPYARLRDEHIKKLAKDFGADVITEKDHVIFEPDEVLKDDLKPYSVFTPYSKKWKSLLKPEHLKIEDSEALMSNQSLNQSEFKGQHLRPVSAFEDLGFESQPWSFPEKSAKVELLKKYQETRNFPAVAGTSMLGLHFRFGTISIRKATAAALKTSETWLNELIWREFFQTILWHFPQTVDAPFRPRYALIKWRNVESEFKAWCEGRTGYPMVDAGMRELNETGFMHNRVRMTTASFLVKHLLIDWTWGERYFAQKLLDFELASNVGNWQWAAGCGTDAAPYFRVFNPESQAEKFDPRGVYLNRWVPERNSLNYPKPIVDHKQARLRALAVYAEAVKETKTGSEH